MSSFAKASLTLHRRALATLLVVTVLAMGALGIAPDLHEELHHDSHHEQHSCAIDQFAHGITPAYATVLVHSPNSVRTTLVTPVRDVDVASPAFRLPPGRAPPVVSI